MKSFFANISLILILGAVTAAVAQGPEHITVRLGHQTSVRGGLRIKFLELVEDSRCPTDTNCVWAGNARIKIRVHGAHGPARTLTLNSTLEAKTVTYGGYEIRFADLNPKPRTNIRINPNGYRATFEITRAGR